MVKKEVLPDTLAAQALMAKRDTFAEADAWKMRWEEEHPEIRQQRQRLRGYAARDAEFTLRYWQALHYALESLEAEQLRFGRWCWVGFSLLALACVVAGAR